MDYDVRQEVLWSRLAAMQGAARRDSLCATRTEARRAARMADEGLFVVHPNRVIALQDADPRVVLCRRIAGVMTCAHAMDHYGLPLLGERGPLHVAVPVTTGRIPEGIGHTVVHRVEGLVIPELCAPPVAEVEQAIICFMRCADELDALIVLDAALRQGCVSGASLTKALPGRRNARLRALLGRACPQARSILETVARYDLENAGYHPVPAVLVEGIGEVDFVLTSNPAAIIPGAVPGTRMLAPGAAALLVETDGYTYHSSRSDWERDHLRDQASARRGLTTLRLTGPQVLARMTVEILAPVAERLGIVPDC